MKRWFDFLFLPTLLVFSLTGTQGIADETCPSCRKQSASVEIPQGITDADLALQTLPPDMQAAIHRLNAYRRAAGLRELQVDPEMSAMAQAHADYVTQNCKGGQITTTGHFEDRANPYYSAAGDEGAHMSGLAFGARTPLQSLEMLIGLPYHRTQLLNTYNDKVGIGFSRGKAPCSVGVIMGDRSKPGKWNQQLPPADHLPGGSHVIAFPPAGMKGVPVEFNPTGENPEPRPAEHGTATGYPVSIRFTESDMAKGVVSVKAKVTDAEGGTVDTWVSHPNDPAVRAQAAPGSIYTADVRAAGTDWIGRNHDSIFILPKTPLRKGTQYEVQALVKFKDGTSRWLRWEFETAVNPIF